MALLLPFLAASASPRDCPGISWITPAPAVLMAPAYAEENVPTQDIQGVLTILIVDGVPLGMLLWGVAYNTLAWGIMALLLSVVFTFLLFRAVNSVYLEHELSKAQWNFIIESARIFQPESGSKSEDWGIISAADISFRAVNIEAIKWQK